MAAQETTPGVKASPKCGGQGTKTEIEKFCDQVF
jgi:hypothetical protein